MVYMFTPTSVPAGMTWPSIIKGSPLSADLGNCRHRVVTIGGLIRSVSSIHARRYVQPASLGPLRISEADVKVERIS
jgi:hypothetical protein